jgi:hypothetical protein
MATPTDTTELTLLLILFFMVVGLLVIGTLLVNVIQAIFRAW